MPTDPNPTLFDRLSRLTHTQAVRLLRPDGAQLLRLGGHREQDIALHLRYGRSLELRLLLPETLPPDIPSDSNCSARGCCPINWMALPLLQLPGAPSSPTRWGWARPSRESVWLSCWPARAGPGDCSHLTQESVGQ